MYYAISLHWHVLSDHVLCDSYCINNAHLLFFFDERLSCPESDSLSELDELLLDEEELELSESVSEACPDAFSRSILSAIAASSGSTFCSTRCHFLLSLGRPRTVLCYTMGKLVLEQKFCVTATVASRFRTTCQYPLGTNTVSPGC